MEPKTTKQTFGDVIKALRKQNHGTMEMDGTDFEKTYNETRMNILERRINNIVRRYNDNEKEESTWWGKILNFLNLSTDKDNRQRTLKLNQRQEEDEESSRKYGILTSLGKATGSITRGVMGMFRLDKHKAKIHRILHGKGATDLMLGTYFAGMLYLFRHEIFEEGGLFDRFKARMKVFGTFLQKKWIENYTKIKNYVNEHVKSFFADKFPILFGLSAHVSELYQKFKDANTKIIENDKKQTEGMKTAEERWSKRFEWVTGPIQEDMNSFKAGVKETFSDMHKKVAELSINLHNKIDEIKQSIKKWVLETLSSILPSYFSNRLHQYMEKDAPIEKDTKIGGGRYYDEVAEVLNKTYPDDEDLRQMLLEESLKIGSDSYSKIVRFNGSIDRTELAKAYTQNPAVKETLDKNSKYEVSKQVGDVTKVSISEIQKYLRETYPDKNYFVDNLGDNVIVVEKFKDQPSVYTKKVSREIQDKFMDKTNKFEGPAKPKGFTLPGSQEREVEDRKKALYTKEEELRKSKERIDGMAKDKLSELDKKRQTEFVEHSRETTALKVESDKDKSDKLSELDNMRKEKFLSEHRISTDKSTDSPTTIKEVPPPISTPPPLTVKAPESEPPQDTPSETPSSVKEEKELPKKSGLLSSFLNLNNTFLGSIKSALSEVSDIIKNPESVLEKLGISDDDKLVVQEKKTEVLPEPDWNNVHKAGGDSTKPQINTNVLNKQSSTTGLEDVGNIPVRNNCSPLRLSNILNTCVV